MNIYNNLKSYAYPSGDKNYNNFISEQKRALQNPSLSREQKNEILQRINKVIEKSKERQVKYAQKQLILEGASTVMGFLGGPIATGVIEGLSVDGPSSKPGRDIYKAQKCGKTRKVTKKKPPEKSTFSQKLAQGIASGIYNAINPIGRALSLATNFIFV